MRSTWRPTARPRRRPRKRGRPPGCTPVPYRPQGWSTPPPPPYAPATQHIGRRHRDLLLHHRPATPLPPPPRQAHFPAAPRQARPGRARLHRPRTLLLAVHTVAGFLIGAVHPTLYILGSLRSADTTGVAVASPHAFLLAVRAAVPVMYSAQVLAGHPLLCSCRSPSPRSCLSGKTYASYIHMIQAHQTLIWGKLCINSTRPYSPRFPHAMHSKVTQATKRALRGS